MLQLFLVDGYFSDVEADATVEASANSNCRLHNRTEGTSTVLGVLVRLSDSAVNLSEQGFVAEQIFSRDVTSFASRYDKCSGGKLLRKIMNGVTGLFVDQAVSWQCNVDYN